MLSKEEEERNWGQGKVTPSLPWGNLGQDGRQGSLQTCPHSPSSRLAPAANSPAERAGVAGDATGLSNCAWDSAAEGPAALGVLEEVSGLDGCLPPPGGTAEGSGPGRGALRRGSPGRKHLSPLVGGIS